MTKDQADTRFCGRCECKIKLTGGTANETYCKFSHQKLITLPLTGGKTLRSAHCMRHYGV